jgi:hypothetical protein
MMSNWTGLSEETAYRYEIRRLEVENSNLNKYIDSLRAEIEDRYIASQYSRLTEMDHLRNETKKLRSALVYALHGLEDVYVPESNYVANTKIALQEEE